MTEPLRRLDNRWIPRLAGRLRRFRLAAAETGRQVAAVQQVAAAFRGEPALAGSIAVVFAAAVLLGAFGTGPDNGRAASVQPVLPTQPSAAVATIGPGPGTAVATYLTRPAVELRHY